MWISRSSFDAVLEVTDVKKAILAKKLGMTQVYAEDGTVVPVTVLQVGPCYVVQKKTVDKDGYEAVQIGFEMCIRDSPSWK